MKDQEFEVKKIRSQYASQPHTELDTLKVLDTRVRRPAIVFGGCYNNGYSERIAFSRSAFPA